MNTTKFLLLLALAACHIPGPLPFSTGPELPNCGDLVVDPGEICDDGSRNDNDVGDCTEQCTLPYCGDGLVHQPTTAICSEARANPTPEALIALARSPAGRLYDDVGVVVGS